MTGTYPTSKPGGEWRWLVMEIVLTAILVSIILDTATGHRGIGHNAGNFGADYTGWWIYIVGPVIGVAVIGLVRGLPDRAERAAAQGGARPILRPGPDPSPGRDTPFGSGTGPTS